MKNIFIGDKIKDLIYKYSKEYYKQTNKQMLLTCAIQSLNINREDALKLLKTNEITFLDDEDITE